VYPEAFAWNPYPYYTNKSDVWPRGFPLKLIRDKKSQEVTSPLPQVPLFDGDRIGVIQSLANQNPDVDALYRLLPFRLPFDFNCHLDDTPLALAPGFGMAPYNAQATLHLSPSFLGLLLPITVKGRVSDIWRSYFTQRTLWDAGEFYSYYVRSIPFKQRWRMGGEKGL